MSRKKRRRSQKPSVGRRTLLTVNESSQQRCEESEEPFSSLRLWLSQHRRHGAALLILLLLSFLLRFPGIEWGLPYQLHPDESVCFLSARYIATYGRITEEMAAASSVAKIGYSYPPLQIRFMVLQRQIIEALQGPETPQSVYFRVARTFNVLEGVANVALVFAITTLLADPATGLLAALFLATNPFSAEHAHIATADTPVASLALLALLTSLLALRTRRPWLAQPGLAFSLLAVMAKYNLVPIVGVPLYVLVRLSYRDRKSLFQHATLALLLVGASFWLLATRYHMFDIVNVPYSPTGSILEKKSWLSFPSLSQNIQVVVEGLGGYFPMFVILAGLIVLAANPQLSQEKMFVGLLLVLAFAVAFLLVMSLFTFSGIRHFVPMVACLSVLWGIGLSALVRLLLRGLPGLRIDFSVATVVVAVLLVIPASLQAVAHLRQVTQKDTRAITADWFIANAPDGASIAVEYDAVEFLPEYGGFPGPKHFQPVVVQSLFQHSLEQYRQADVRYLVADERARGNGGYFSDPDNLVFTAGVRMVLDIPNEHNPGPRRIIFELVD